MHAFPSLIIDPFPMNPNPFDFRTSADSHQDLAPNGILFVSLYAAELSALMVALGFYKKGDQPIVPFLSGHAGQVSLLALVLFIVSFTAIMWVYCRSSASSQRRLGLTIAMNLVTVITLLTTGELAVRFLSSRSPYGSVFLKTRLLPRNWDDVVSRNRQLLTRASLDGSFLVSDELLGWTVGANRRSADGLYLSSIEGIRSPRPDMAFSRTPATHRIALVGDSFTFGLEVSYEESWGAQLEGALGPGVQVLNFGVDGYGVDQAYLRYWRDVRPWQPDIVIFGLINHDFFRTMVVYPFVTFPEWGVPFTKPRFVITDGKLTLLNVPLISPDEILSKQVVTDLPFIEYDIGYHAVDWDRRYYHLSYLSRYLVSRFPRWPVPGPYTTNEATQAINRELLHSFARLAIREGSFPIIVYFPARSDFDFRSSHPLSEKTFGQGILQDAGLTHVDLTSCLAKLNPSDRFVMGRPHYSPNGNAAIAKCLQDVVRTYGFTGWS